MNIEDAAFNDGHFQSILRCNIDSGDSDLQKI